MFAYMGSAEVTHSGLCDAVDAIFEHGQERRSELELFHFLLINVYFVPDMPVTNRAQR